MHAVHPTPEQIDELRDMRFRHPCPATQRGIEAGILADFGIPYKDIAAILGIRPNSVAHFIILYNQGGLKRLKQRRKGDGDTEFRDFDKQTRDYWNRNPPRIVREAAAYMYVVLPAPRPPIMQLCPGENWM